MPESTVEHCIPFTWHANEAKAYYDQETKQIILDVDIAQNPDYQVSSHKWEYERSEFPLNQYLGFSQDLGKLKWGPKAACGFDHENINITNAYLVNKYILNVKFKEASGISKTLEIDLRKHIGISKGKPVFAPEGTNWPKEAGMPGYATDPLKDGNIRASAFTVASDATADRCRVAYKTQIDDRVCLAEILYQNGSWHDPEEIETWASKMPGDQFALVFDPKETSIRHLFFSEPDGDGYIYQQTYKGGKWNKPKKPRDLQGREMAIKAHRFSGFAATCDDENDLILFYFVDESNTLLEYAGKYCVDPSGHIPPGYRWTRTAVICENMTLREHISAITKHKKTYLVYRAPNHDLCMAIGRERKRWGATLKRNDKCGEAQWSDFVVREKNQLAKDSPLAVAVGPDALTPKVFYLHKDRKTETIMALDILKNIASYESIVAVPVGKLEPGSDIAAASLPKCSHNIRLYSVSKLDGDNILVERVQKGGHYGAWCLSGGVVDTDVDHIKHPRSLDWEHTKTDDD